MKASHKYTKMSNAGAMCAAAFYAHSNEEECKIREAVLNINTHWWETKHLSPSDRDFIDRYNERNKA